MVKAMAPKAPIGAAFMMMPTTPKKAWAVLSMKRYTGLPFSPIAESAKPNMRAKRSTWRMSPLAKASTTLDGMMFIRKSTVLVDLAWVVMAVSALVSILETSALKPTPGCSRVTTARPMASARLETTSK